MLRDKYQSHLKDFYPKFFNADYPKQKLENKIQKHFDHRILFFQPKYKSEIVYSGEISTAQAVELVYDSSSSTVKMLENCADILRREILEKKTENSDSTWPPSSDYLYSCPVPEDLTII